MTIGLWLNPHTRKQWQYERYAALAAQEKGVSFVGRLATYRYYNMDQVTGMALAEFERLGERLAK